MAVSALAMKREGCALGLSGPGTVAEGQSAGHGGNAITVEIAMRRGTGFDRVTPAGGPPIDA